MDKQTNVNLENEIKKELIQILIEDEDVVQTDENISAYDLTQKIQNDINQMNIRRMSSKVKIIVNRHNPILDRIKKSLIPERFFGGRCKKCEFWSFTDQILILLISSNVTGIVRDTLDLKKHFDNDCITLDTCSSTELSEDGISTLEEIKIDLIPIVELVESYVKRYPIVIVNNQIKFKEGNHTLLNIDYSIFHVSITVDDTGKVKTIIELQDFAEQIPSNEANNIQRIISENQNDILRKIPVDVSKLSYYADIIQKEGNEKEKNAYKVYK